jgi:hypothetical protein
LGESSGFSLEFCGGIHDDGFDDWFHVGILEEIEIHDLELEELWINV